MGHGHHPKVLAPVPAGTEHSFMEIIWGQLQSKLPLDGSYCSIRELNRKPSWGLQSSGKDDWPGYGQG